MQSSLVRTCTHDQHPRHIGLRIPENHGSYYHTHTTRQHSTAMTILVYQVYLEILLSVIPPLVPLVYPSSSTLSWGLTCLMPVVVYSNPTPKLETFLQCRVQRLCVHRFPTHLQTCRDDSRPFNLVQVSRFMTLLYIYISRVCIMYIKLRSFKVALRVALTTSKVLRRRQAHFTMGERYLSWR
jgi:hypothetical protein